jgi:ADP-ribose pyrophosphatase
MKIISDNPPEQQGGFFKVHKLNLQGKRGPVVREYVNSKDAVCAVVYDTVKNKYIFTKQFRPGPKMVILELCAGMIDHVGENEMETMKREILEELGYQTDTINQIVKPYFPTPGKTNERISIYFATVSQKIAQGGGLESENEEIEIIEMTKEEVKRSEFVDGKTLMALLVLKLK